MNYDIKAGFSRIEINPPLGVHLEGYFHERKNEGILDDLEINTVVLEKDGATVALISIDSEAADTAYYEAAREAVAKATGLKKEGIFIHTTHTHVGACFGRVKDYMTDIDREYDSFVMKKLADSVIYAIADLTPARLGVGFSKAERIGFNRRYLMKDGTTKTNPGVNNPDIVRSIGLLDETVNVIRLERENAADIVIGNYGNHPDVIGGNKASADWPGFARRIFERAVENTKCIFFNGAQGDINHVNVKPVGGDFNGMFIDFDDVSRGYAHSRHMGNVVAGAMMSVYEKVEFIPVNEIKFTERVIQVASNMPKPEEMEEAFYIQKMIDEGRRDELPYKGMMLTTMMADAGRKIRLQNGPETFPMNITAVKIGEIVFVGIPGEPFTGIGMGIKQAEGYKMICPTCLTNGSRGYFPMKDSYQEGGYEARSSQFKEGVAEFIIEKSVELLNDLNK